MSDLRSLSARAAFASHRLIGWIFWDPRGIERYAALGIPNGAGYYVTTRAGLLGHAGASVVTAAYGSIHPEFISVSYALLDQHASVDDAIRVRDEAVLAGLAEHAPEICADLAAIAPALWEAADTLPSTGRPLFAAQSAHRRPDEPTLDAWLAVNCIREWRGDTHWALQIADDLTGTEAGVLDGAWRDYEADWLPRSRGADDAALAEAYRRLEARGFVTDGRVNPAGVAHRQRLEDRLDDLSVGAWTAFGEAATESFISLVDRVGDHLVSRIDATAGERWMPAARRHHRSRA
ncbi:MAG: SCO6745 family protein [Ilumatobacteraceae bacterium]